MNLSEALQEINSIPMIPKWTPTLDKMSQAIKLTYPEIAKYQDQIFLVAGTNGKGTTSKILSQLFYKSGENVGLYTSPHRIRINERIQINNQEISDEDFLKSYLKIRPICKELSLSHFEILTLLCLDYFYPHLDNGMKVILEVGMGGRWDATNAIPHKYSILCPIGMDHQKFLGDRLEDIAANKFDIIQQDNIVFSHDYPDTIRNILNNKCEEQNATNRFYSLPNTIRISF